MLELLGLWWVYWLVGLIGIFGHIISKLGQGETIASWVRSNWKDFAFSLMGYHLVLFLWIDEGAEWLGLIKNSPTLMTFMIGWFGNSILSNLVKQYEKRVSKIAE